MDIFRSHREKRKHRYPGIIEKFLDDPTQQTMEIKLYHREIRRFERLYPEIDIIKGNRFNSTDLWECTIIKRQ